MSETTKKLEGAQESLASIIERAEAGEEIPEDEARAMLDGIADVLRAFADAIEPEFEAGRQKVRATYPDKGIVSDPRLWILKHHPDMLEDSQVTTFLGLGGQNIDKNVKRAKRKKTTKMYSFTTTLEESKFIETLVEIGIDYLISNFHINIAKRLKEEYFRYSMRNDYRLNIQEMVVLRKAVSNYLENLSDTFLYGPADQKDGLDSINNLLGKEIEVTRRTYWSEITDDGLYGESQREIEKMTTKFIDTYNKKEANNLGMSLLAFAKSLLEENNNE